MKILFLDDEYSRAYEFRKRTGLPISHVLLKKDFESAVSDHSWDLICLDHDLGPFDGWGGLVAAKFLAENRLLVGDNQHIIIHSLNPIGVANMMSVMKHCDHLQVDCVRSLWSRVSYSVDTGLIIA